MRSIFCAALALAIAAGESGQAKAENQPVLAWHFAGLPAVRKSNPKAPFTEISELKSSDLLGRELRGLVTAHSPGWFGLDARKFSADVVAPLVADLQDHESVGNVSGDSLTGGDWVLAVALDQNNTKLWNSGPLNIGRRLEFGEPQAVMVAGIAGWKLPSTTSMRGYAMLFHKDWVLVANRFDDGTIAAKWAKAIQQDGRPVPPAGENWLTFSVNPAALHWPAKLPFAGTVEQVEGSLSWQGDNIRTAATLSLASDLPPSDAAWQIPKDIVHDPLISFTAVRNLKAFIGNLAAFRGMSSELMPDQWFGWTMGTVAFVDDFAMPVSDATKAFAFLERSVPEAYNADIMKLSLGKWLSATNSSRLLWRGLPVFVPYLGPTNDSGQGYVNGGIFPLSLKTNAPSAPGELFAQVESRKDLVYYDWEIAPARLAAFKQIHPFVDLVLPPAKTGKSAFAVSWLNDVQSHLGKPRGNVITEISRSGPRELSLTRKSDLGMTGIELWLFAHWVDSEDFPAFPYGKPQRPDLGKKPAGLPGKDASGKH